MLLQSLLCKRKGYKNRHPQENINFTSSPGENISTILYICYINSVQNRFSHHEKWSPKVPIPINFFSNPSARDLEIVEYIESELSLP